MRYLPHLRSIGLRTQIPERQEPLDLWDSQTVGFTSLPYLTPMDLTQHFEKEIAANWELKNQQMDSRLAGTVETDSFRGKRKQYNQLAKRTMQEVTTRKGDTPDGNSTTYKYWIYRRKFEDVIIYDEDDELNLGAISMPDSPEITQMISAGNRTKDSVIIASLDATRYIGENGTDTDAFDTNFDVAVNYVASGSPANSGLTLAKIAKAKQLLDEQEASEDRTFVHTAQQLQDMLLIDKMTSEDYAAVKALVDGKVERFLGFRFVRTELLSLNTGTDVRTCFAYTRDAVKFADAGRTVHINERADMRHAKQIRYVMRCGAVRQDNDRVVRIACDESP